MRDASARRFGAASPRRATRPTASVEESQVSELVPAFVSVTPLPAVAALERLTYSVPARLRDSIRVGCRVVVPLGPRRVTALVVGVAESAPEGVRCRDLLDAMDESPIVPGKLLSLLEWMADYYLASFGDALSLAVGKALTSSSQRVVRLKDPAAATGELEQRVVGLLERASRPLATASIARALGRRTVDRLLASMSSAGAVAIEDVLAAPRAKTQYETVVAIERLPDEATEAALLSRAPRRRALFEHLAALPGRRALLSDLLEDFPQASASLAALADAGIVRTSKRERFRAPHGYDDVAAPPDLSADQNAAVGAVTAALGTFSTFLLQGVTAAGKTEVYLRAVAAALERRQGALVLVPEISLTHQTVARLRGRFGADVAVLHSELTPGERWDEWRRLARGLARVAVGARSAVLAPVADLGLIVVDEEHDSAYKQEEGLRYHARDTAVVRGRIEGCPVVLGSATPSLESWRHGLEGRYRRLVLPTRVTPSPPPRIELVDLRGQPPADSGLGEALIAAMRENFSARGQTLLFLNRRGYARSLQCWACGVSLECDACSVALTLHQSDRSLRCHHCDSRRAIPSLCTNCGADSLVSQGLGTQRLETSVRSLLPGARVARLDRDATERRGLLAETLAAWRRREVDVLIGTQMIAKGHDVPGVTLVGVVQADLSLGVPDFRGAERTFQLLSQVAGRAGRGSERGRVLVQTFQPEHPAIRLAALHDFDAFASDELRDRAALGYPPYTRLAIVRIDGPERAAVERLASRVARSLLDAGAADPSFVVRGPAPAVVERIKGRYRYQVQARSARSSSLRAAMARARADSLAAARSARIRLGVDVDPVDMF